MTQLAGMTEIYLHRDVVDFRKSINGLMIIVESEMKLSPFSGGLFIFCNRSRDKIKALYWDETGFCLWYKRLEKDKFKWPRKFNQSLIHLSEQQWQWLLSGLDVMKMQTHQPLLYEAIR
ncbi:MAG: IS66 family insertion sequence element accessory protein TnpB [Enterobacterales bacterium]|nr:IS66 family insertion sequence element accessory protein TnpB [Enterobacterales bacterium]MDQ7048360.1 IS66 family insertion sequence element accessory protein TnpB [Enterobacterales bacterium]